MGACRIGESMNRVETRLAELGLTLPSPTPPIATYVPTVISGSTLYISGQVSVDAAGGVKGIVGEDVDLATAQRAAQICALNLVAQMKLACGGDLERVKRIVKLGGFVQAGPGFYDIPQVINGCSDLMVELFGDAGRHARSAVGVYRLPLNFAVEIDAVVELA
jgi:enamine deaminase RidA (YjgF/YER057c/UK114 family)